MFRDMGWSDEVRLAELAPAYETYVREQTECGAFTAWVAEKDGCILGAVGLLWERVPPTVRNLSGSQAYVLSLYVVPEARRQGLAGRLIGKAVEHARVNGAEVVSLHASPAGKALYEQLGFVESPEYRLFTDPSSAAWTPRAPR
jgi:GNAT superfamily N-acetyltransferase